VIVLHGLQGSAESNYARGLLKEIEAQCGGFPHFSSLLNGMPLGSSSQRNTFAKFLCWGKILQCLPRALVESKSNLVEVRLGVLG